MPGTPASTYVKNPPYFDGMKAKPAPVEDMRGARILALFGDSITTDHISPAGAIKKDGPAGRYLIERGVKVADFNSYGSRRGNDEVMVRGTFANIRIRNEMMGGARRRQHASTHPRRRGDVDLRRGDEISRRRRAGGRGRRQGIRHRLQPRLGGQGPEASGRARRHHRKLRAHPPLQPDRHGGCAFRFRRRQDAARITG